MDSNTYVSVRLEIANEGLGVFMNLVGRGIASKGVDVCVVSIHHDPCLDAAHCRGEELAGPEDPILGGPCLCWVAVETVDDDNATLGLA